MELIQIINQNVKYGNLKNKILECLDNSSLEHKDKNKIFDIFNSRQIKKFNKCDLIYILKPEN